MDNISYIISVNQINDFVFFSLNYVDFCVAFFWLDLMFFFYVDLFMCMVFFFQMMRRVLVPHGTHHICTLT